MALLLIVFVLIPCAVISGSVAKSKGCSEGSWAAAGFFFGPMALIGAAGLPDRKLRRTMRLIAEAQGIIVNEEIPNSTGKDSGTDIASDPLLTTKTKNQVD